MSKLSEEVKDGHYDQFSRDPLQLDRDESRVAGPLARAYLALKLLASTAIRKVPRDPDAIDEELKAQTKFVPAKRPAVEESLDLCNAPRAARVRIDALFGKEVQNLQLGSESNPFVINVHGIHGEAREVSIQRDRPESDGTKPQVRFPATHLWCFDSSKGKDKIETMELMRVKWALDYVPGFKSFADRESWDGRYSVGQDKIFALIERLQVQLDEARVANKSIDFEFDTTLRLNRVVWPKGWAGEVYEFPAGRAAVEAKGIIKYKQFLHEFAYKLFSKHDEYTLSSCIRVLIFHHTKIDGFVKDYHSRKQFELLSLLGRFVGASCDALLGAPVLRGWRADDFSTFMPQFDARLRREIEQFVGDDVVDGVSDALMSDVDDEGPHIFE